MRDWQPVEHRFLGMIVKKLYMVVDRRRANAIRSRATDDDAGINPAVDQQRKQWRAEEGAVLLLVDNDLGRQRPQFRDDFGPVRAGEIEIVATADTGANLPMKHADIVVNRIDHVAREEYRDAGDSRCSEQARHLISGSKGGLAAGQADMPLELSCAPRMPVM